MHRRKELGPSKTLSAIADNVTEADARVFLGGPGPANSPVRAWVFRQQGIDRYKWIAGSVDLPKPVKCKGSIHLPQKIVPSAQRLVP